jgi:hypothetical protein
MASIAVAPVAVTDRTAPAVLGLEPRVFRAFIASRRIPHARIGRRVVVCVSDVLDAIDALATEQGHGTARPSRDLDANELTADEILARIGRVRSAARDPGSPSQVEPWSEERVLADLRADSVLEKRAQEWLATRGSKRIEDIADPSLRGRVLRVERRHRRRAGIDAKRASKGLATRRWR